MIFLFHWVGWGYAIAIEALENENLFELCLNNTCLPSSFIVYHMMIQQKYNHMEKYE